MEKMERKKYDMNSRIDSTNQIWGPTMILAN